MTSAAPETTRRDRRRPVVRVAVVAVAVVVGSGFVLGALGDSADADLPAAFSATTPDGDVLTGDDIARIRGCLADPRCRNVKVGDISAADVFPLNAPAPDVSNAQWAALSETLASTCDEARARGFILKITATTDASGTRDRNVELASERAEITAVLVEDTTCWNRDEVLRDPQPAAAEGGVADQTQRRVIAAYVQPNS